MKRIPTLAAAALLLSACAAPSQGLLDQTRLACSMGMAEACGYIPIVQAQVTSEQNQQAAAVGLALLGVAAIAADAALSDPYCCYTPHYHHRHW
jgi:hypothetical protein